MKTIRSTLLTAAFATFAALATLAACGQQASDTQSAQTAALPAAPSQQQTKQQEKLQPTALASCRVGSEDFSLVRLSRGTVAFGNETSAIITATKELRKDTLSYLIQTAAGNSIEIRLPYPVAGGGSVLILDRGVIGGHCDPDSIKLDLKSLDVLVADSLPQPKYLFAQCSWYGKSGARVTVRKGIEQNTIVFEADLSEQGRGGETLAYVATGFTPGSGTAGEPDFIDINGAGSISWSGLGRHAAAIQPLKLTSFGEIVFGDSPQFPPLVNCTITNLDFVRKTITGN
jgi:hypothetical protein